MELIITMKILVSDEFPNMVLSLPNRSKNCGTLDHDRKVTKNEVAKGEISPRFGFLRHTPLNVISN